MSGEAMHELGAAVGRLQLRTRTARKPHKAIAAASSPGADSISHLWTRTARTPHHAVSAILQSGKGALYQTARPPRRQPGIRMRVTSQAATDRRAGSDMAEQSTRCGEPLRGVAMLQCPGFSGSAGEGGGTTEDPAGTFMERVWPSSAQRSSHCWPSSAQRSPLRRRSWALLPWRTRFPCRVRN